MGRPLLHVVEEYGAAVDAGLLPLDEAVQALVATGLLTAAGARRVLGQWQDYRRVLGDELMDVELMLAAIEAGSAACAVDLDLTRFARAHAWQMIKRRPQP